MGRALQSADLGVPPPAPGEEVTSSIPSLLLLLLLPVTMPSSCQLFNLPSFCHQLTISSSSIYFQDNQFTDVTLASETKTFQAHRLLLSVCSPYFKQLFTQNPDTHPIVFVKVRSGDE